MEYDVRPALDGTKKIAQRFGIVLDYSLESIESIDVLIDYIYNIKEAINDEDVIWRIAVSLGTYLGETMLDNNLREEGFSWSYNDEGIPVVSNQSMDASVSPITKIFKIFLYGSEEGSAKSLYDSFYLLMDYYKNK